jgi:choline dehydrogenase
MPRPNGYDVLVVGAGAAGCVTAARLAQAGSRSVALLEAGPDLRGGVPGALRDGWRISREPDWGYVSDPNPRGNVQNVWRNKLVGGTSWQTRFAPRGAPGDYDEWAARGNIGWSFDDVLPYFRRLEADRDFGDAPWHGASGPIPVTRYLEFDYTDIAAAGLRAAEAAGFPAVEDHNAPGAVGLGRMPMTTERGRRVTTADAYLGVDATPGNLTVLANSHVAEVVLDATRANGVRLVDGSIVEGGHVILCAGVYGSAPILMRSGIGPAEHLRSHGITVRVDLPGVGANLADHPTVAIDCGYRGAMRNEPIMHFIATFHSSSQPSGGPPDLMLWASDPEETALFEIVVVLLRPRSRGKVELRSADPADSPRVQLPALSDEFDVRRLVEGYGRALEIANHDDVRRLCEEDATPAPLGGDLTTMLCASAFSLPHVVGTCAMGPRVEEGAVVDASGRVHGVECLTVADASIMPDVPSGFTHLPTIMLAERLSEQLSAAI